MWHADFGAHQRNQGGNALRECVTAHRTEMLWYDYEGNLTATDPPGTTNDWTYTWDGENRLVAAYKTSPSSSSDRKLVLKYDYAGRRVEKKVYA